MENCHMMRTERLLNMHVHVYVDVVVGNRFGYCRVFVTTLK